MVEEMKWFQEGNWNNEKDATHFIFQFKTFNFAIVKVIKYYLESLEMKARNPEEFKDAAKVKSKSSYVFSGICVDMVNREFFFLARHDCDTTKTGWYKAYPSQVSDFTKNNYGRLTGKRFGL